MKKIKGNLFLWIPVILFTLYITRQYWMIQIVYNVFFWMYLIFNLVGIMVMWYNYKYDRHIDTSCQRAYYWDLDYWLSQPNLEYNYKKGYPFFRIFSISCWIIYGILLINRWFNNKLTIVIKDDRN